MARSPGDTSASRKRQFKINSEFGGARTWRSRKTRPCDACRRRKSACVIEDQPPCLFCRDRGLQCEANIGPSHPRRHRTRATRSSESSGPLSDDHDGPQLTEAVPVVSNDIVELDATMNFSSPYPGFGDIQFGSPVASRTTLKDSPPALDPMIPAPPGSRAKTAHLMGLSAEQDTHLLASFRSFIMDELDQVSGEIVQVHPGSTATGKPPIHFCILHDAFMPWDTAIRQEASETIERKVAPYGPDLVKLYFKHVHPVYCVLSKARFLRAYRYDLLSIPASLRGVVYGLAAVFWKQDETLMNIPRPFEQYELFHAAQASLERELDAPNLWKLQACLLMLHEQPAQNHTFQTPRTWTLSAQAVACAQMIGLHRDPTDWNIEPWEKSLRKKLWWATYMTDTWSSVSHGNPTHINRGFYTTSNANMDDMRFDEEVPDDLRDMVHQQNANFDVSSAARFLEQMSLTQILHEILDQSFTDQSYQAARSDSVQHEITLQKLRRELESWHSLLPQCATMEYSRAQGQCNGPIHLAYFATFVLLFRALMAPASMTAKRNPQSSLRRYYGDAIIFFRDFLDFMDKITFEGLRGFWGRHARAQLLLLGNYLELLFLLPSDIQEVKASFEMLERFHASLQRLTDLADEDILTLIRPVAIRIDSFFTQAARIMRESTLAGSHLGGIILDTTP